MCAWSIEQQIVRQQQRYAEILLSVPTRAQNSLSNRWALAFRLLHVPMSDSIAFETGQPVDISRNITCTKALQLKTKYVLFWDSDVIANPDSLDILLSVKMPVVSACYRSRGDPYQILANIGDRAVTDEEIKANENGIIKVDEVGMGFCLIDTRVLRAMASKMNEWRCMNNHKRDIGRDVAIFDNKAAETNNYKCEICKKSLLARFFWFRLGSQNMDAVSEDYWFCLQAKRLGYPVVVVPRVFLPHESTVGEIGRDGITNHLRSSADID